MTMADLLAKQDSKQLNLTRGQAVTGSVIAVYPQEIILDLGSKAEGVLPKKDLPIDKQESIKEGDIIETFVLQPEGPSGQVILTTHSAGKGKQPINPKWNRFLNALNTSQTFSGQGVEINKGGLIVEVSGMRGFIPSSQVAPSFIAKMDELIGKNLSLQLIEVDPVANRLIFSQKAEVSQETKKLLTDLKEGDKVSGKVSATLPFGVLVKLESGVEGFVHISEASWERSDDATKLFELNQEVEAQVLSVDLVTGKLNLSLKVLQEDPFQKLVEKFSADDVVKATITSSSPSGVTVNLDGVEATMPATAMEPGKVYQTGELITVLIDKVDKDRRKITVSPMLTSTSGLIYK